MPTVTSREPSLLVAEVEVVRAERLTPTFVRVHLGGSALADFGGDGPLLDQRIKLLLPPGGGRPPSIARDDSWYDAWLGLPAEERGHLRTYTVRDVVGTGAETRVVVDVALHEGDGAAGPGARWAAAARPGSRAVLLGPRRGVPYGGIEFEPGTAERLLLAGDETAVPAICSILGALPADAVGAAFLEVPVAADVLPVAHPERVEVVWLSRDGAEHGERLHAAVLQHLGAPLVEPPATWDDAEVDPDLWETPTYSSSGEAVDRPVTLVGHDLAGTYAWIAGEATLVTALRRALVGELGMDRRQVAFMGYWRRGVAMRS
jgi:NADPH-dependent ferric siderophore reductase